uniref:ZSWIM1/3 RNaseH-like domain-containing protein n=1 Tax=Amphimedon queenslandica TaxID=400682 RepID=A0A1X7VRL7_AMPQE
MLVFTEAENIIHKYILKYCPFQIKLRLSPDGNKLVIQDIFGQHNHSLSSDVFRHMPKQRRLDKDTMESTSHVLSFKANKKMVQNHVISSTGKAVTMKDVHNLAAKSKTNKHDYKELVSEMNKIQGAKVTVFVDEENTLQALYCQTKEMIVVFQPYPELLFIDTTYKLNDLYMPLSVLLCIDGDADTWIRDVSGEDIENQPLQDESNACCQTLDSQDAGCSGSIALVKMPPRMKKGRPKGSGQTVIGLPKKSSGRVIAFSKKSSEKVKIMLSWFVDEDTAQNAFRNGILIKENKVEVQPEKVPMKCLDDSV